MSFRIGTLFGINIRVHILLILFVAFRLFSSSDPKETLVFVSMLFVIILIHELGHCFGARSVGGDAREIMMWPLGGLAFAHAPMTPWAQFVTVACGPLVNVVFCIVAGAVMVTSVMVSGIKPPASPHLWGVISSVLWINPLGGPSWGLFDPATGQIASWYWWVMMFYTVNLWLLAFNMLPIYPFDGGQLFFTAIWPFVGIHQATDIACKVGLGGAVILAFLGLSGRGGSLLFFIAIFGGMACWQRLQALKYGMVFDERIGTYDHVARSKPPRRRRSWFGGKPAPPKQNPNPGAWTEKLSEHERLEQEVDEILKKVSERGLHSLTYAERSKLERASRERRGDFEERAP